jgi:hypothetical protein
LRTTPVTPAVLAALVVLLVSTGAAVGSAPSATPKKWVATFCTSTRTWERTLKSGIVKLQGAVAKYKDGEIGLSTLKDDVVAFLGKLVKASNSVVTQVRAVGPPKVENGDKIQQGELHAFGQAKKVFQNARKAARALSTSNVQEFGKGLTAVGSSITAAGAKISAAESKLHKYGSKALKDAAAHQPACSEVRSFLP